jgi:preprotein translocase subunit SecD
MLNKYPLWKYLLIFSIIGIATIYASPVLFPSDSALQVSGRNASVKVDDSTYRKVKSVLTREGSAASVEKEASGSILVRFPDEASRRSVKDVLEDDLGEDYVVALNMAQTTPQWLQDLGASPMNLGLDLRGGVHFLLEVDIQSALEPHLKSYQSDIRKQFKEADLTYKKLEIKEQSLEMAFDDDESRTKASSLIIKNYPEFVADRVIKEGALLLEIRLSDQKLKEIKDYAIGQNLATLRNRVNELGVSEPIVQRQGASRIVVELPGVQDPAKAKGILGRAASLEFRLEDWEHTGRSAIYGPVPFGSERFPFKENRRPPVLVKNRIIVKGDRVIDARSGFDEDGMPQVSIKLDNRGGKQMNSVTSKHVKKAMVVIFVEYKTSSKEVMKEGEKVLVPVTKTEKYVINVATIQEPLGFNFRITGLDSVAEAQELALLLRAGALAAPMYFVEERTVGPSLGAENIEAGMNSIIFGFVLVMIFMIIYYKVFGLVANVALVLNLVLLVAIMSLLGATLTLPGMAGFVLLGGMAVDANVIIFSRIKEEIAKGEPPQSAISAGYDRAFTAIIDANLTTIAVAGVLFLMATGSVKGFAVTLAFGILSSLFTSIMVTRALVNLIYGNRQIKTLRI